MEGQSTDIAVTLLVVWKYLMSLNNVLFAGK